MPKNLPTADDASLRAFVQEAQAALDQAEMAHRSALAAHRRAGDKLLDLAKALRARSSQREHAAHLVGQASATRSPSHRSPDVEAVVPPLLITIGEACKMTGIGRATLYKYLNEGAFVARKIGSRTMIMYASLTEWLDACPTYDEKLIERKHSTCFPTVDVRQSGHPDDADRLEGDGFQGVLGHSGLKGVQAVTI